MQDPTARLADIEAIDRLVGLSSDLAKEWAIEWGADASAGERLPYVEVGTISRYLVGLVNDERWDEVSVFASEIERMLAEHRFADILKIGLIESIQNTTANYREDHGGHVTAGAVKARLGLLAQAAWESLERDWGNSTDDH